MPRPFLLVCLGLLGLGIGYAASFLSSGAPVWALWAFLIGMALVLVGMMATGARHPRRPLGAVVPVLVLVAVAIVGGFAAGLLLPADTADPVLLIGLPRRAALVLLGTGVVPMLVLPLAYAMTFDRLTLSDDDVAALRAVAARMRGE